MHSPACEDIEFIPDYPSNIAADLKEGRIDLGLVPVAIIPDLSEWHIVGNYCIGCNGPVASVCLFSEVPIAAIKTALLDYQSRTSTALARILLRDYWKINPEYIQGSPGYLAKIKGNTAGLVIGDRSFEQKASFPYVYDLGQAWKAHTGLPFVFAAWISNKVLEKGFVEEFNKANAYGLTKIPEVVAENPYGLFDLQDYYTKYISYELDGEKRKGLELFLELLKGEKNNVTSGANQSQLDKG